MKPGTSGPDPLKILPMLMPNMDPSAKRMCSILLKCRELMELMEAPAPAASPDPPPSPAEGPSDSASDPELLRHLQEGLTPEQQNMITSLTSMMKS